MRTRSSKPAILLSEAAIPALTVKFMVPFAPVSTFSCSASFLIFSATYRAPPGPVPGSMAMNFAAVPAGNVDAADISRYDHRELFYDHVAYVVAGESLIALKPSMSSMMTERLSLLRSTRLNSIRPDSQKNLLL